MKLCIRPPRENEWAVCRMLLPETFGDVASRSYVLAVRDEAPRVVAAASFRHAHQAITHLRLHVIPGFRRLGVGSQLVEHIARGDARSMEGTVEITSEPAAVAFCERNQFERVESLTTVEADIAEMRDYTRRLRLRLGQPAGACVMALADAPADQVAELHARYVAQEGEIDRWRGLVAQTPQMGISPVVMIDGRVAGILLGELEGATAVVRSRVVAPGYHGSWVNVLLLAEAMDIGWAAGARRARFFYTDTNRDTQKLAARFQAKVTSVVARFQRRLPR